jgi:NADH-quinone oxidoreductase subunit G
LPFDSLASLRKLLYAANPRLAEIGRIAPADGAAALAGLVGIAGSAFPPFEGSDEDYYLSNAIARASPVMAQCSKLAREAAQIAAE